MCSPAQTRSWARQRIPPASKGQRQSLSEHQSPSLYAVRGHGSQVTGTVVRGPGIDQIRSDGIISADTATATADTTTTTTCCACRGFYFRQLHVYCICGIYVTTDGENRPVSTQVDPYQYRPTHINTLCTSAPQTYPCREIFLHGLLKGTPF